MIPLVMALRITRSKTKHSQIVDVKVLVLKKYLVPPCRKVVGTRRGCYFLSDSHTEFKNMTSLCLFSSCFSFLCLGTDISLNEQNVPPTTDVIGLLVDQQDSSKFQMKIDFVPRQNLEHEFVAIFRM
jgi:hypothetical protein